MPRFDSISCCCCWDELNGCSIYECSWMEDGFCFEVVWKILVGWFGLGSVLGFSCID